MSIDKSGKWWIGTSVDDLREYLEAYSADNYCIHEFRPAKCKCGGETFELLADDDEGCAKRTCTSCAIGKFICDSEEYWSDATPEQWKCIECGSTSANIALVFPCMKMVRFVGSTLVSDAPTVAFLAALRVGKLRTHHPNSYSNGREQT